MSGTEPDGSRDAQNRRLIAWLTTLTVILLGLGSLAGFQADRLRSEQIAKLEKRVQALEDAR